jgi:hypothetical protein
MLGPIPWYSVNIYLYQQNDYYQAAYITSPYGDTEWTQNYKLVHWMYPSRWMWYQTAAV